MARSLLAVGLLQRCSQPAIPDQPPAAAVPSLYGGGRVPYSSLFLQCRPLGCDGMMRHGCGVLPVAVLVVQ